MTLAPVMALSRASLMRIIGYHSNIDGAFLASAMNSWASFLNYWYRIGQGALMPRTRCVAMARLSIARCSKMSSYTVSNLSCAAHTKQTEYLGLQSLPRAGMKPRTGMLSLNIFNPFFVVVNLLVSQRSLAKAEARQEMRNKTVIVIYCFERVANEVTNLQTNSPQVMSHRLHARRPPQDLTKME
jgi:hypothetical protein